MNAMFGFLIALACAASPIAAQAGGDFDILDFVDPLIGSNGGGNVFCGATLPYGLVRCTTSLCYGQDITMHVVSGNFPSIASPGSVLCACPAKRLRYRQKHLPMSMARTQPASRQMAAMSSAFRACTTLEPAAIHP